MSRRQKAVSRRQEPEWRKRIGHISFAIYHLTFGIPRSRWTTNFALDHTLRVGSQIAKMKVEQTS